MQKLRDMNSKFQAVKIIASTGEKLASETIKIALDIEKLLNNYKEVMSSDVKMNEFKSLASEEEIAYTLKIAQILGESLAKIKAVE